jgi:hypothetical protein
VSAYPANNQPLNSSGAVLHHATFRVTDGHLRQHPPKVAHRLEKLRSSAHALTIHASWHAKDQPVTVELH